MLDEATQDVSRFELIVVYKLRNFSQSTEETVLCRDRFRAGGATLVSTLESSPPDQYTLGTLTPRTGELSFTGPQSPSHHQTNRPPQSLRLIQHRLTIAVQLVGSWHGRCESVSLNLPDRHFHPRARSALNFADVRIKSVTSIHLGSD